MPKLTEADIEQAAMEWMDGLNYSVLHGSNVSPGETQAERLGYEEVLLPDRLRSALEQLNPALPPAALEEAVTRIKAVPYATASLLENNRLFHQMLVAGIPVQYRAHDGRLVDERAVLLDFATPNNNDFAALNQFSVVENRQNRRLDLLLFVNGLPLAAFEFKSAVSSAAKLVRGFQQFQTYKNELKNLMAYNELLVVSDGLEARRGTLSADWERFQPWRTILGDSVTAKGSLELETLTKGIFEKRRFLDILEHFLVFERDDRGGVIKKMAAYHQFHAVNKAVAYSLLAASPSGDRRAGVVWHTQGSGKSLSMVFYAGKVIRHPQMENPTLVILTDRNDLDQQLFQTFSNCQELLRQEPQQAASRRHLRDLLQGRTSGGVIFTTIQNFVPVGDETRYPLLSERRNILFIADEAHRSQYNFRAKGVVNEEGIDISFGYAQHLRDALPNASFIGFTGTPIESVDINTRSVFGEYIDVYDIRRAVEDGATVPIYYEAHVIPLELKEEDRDLVNEEFAEITEEEEEITQDQLKSKWSRLEAMVGSPRRLKKLAEHIVSHVTERLATFEGKAMIVCMSRRICVELYEELIKMRPEWEGADDASGFLKIIMTGSASDPERWQSHIRSKARRRKLADAYKDPTSGFNLVIVRDMWLTGFDAPCLHTMYLDKPMQGHGLMQAIARVNRVYKDKPAGLIVDYLGLADKLKQALKDYTETDQQQTGIDIQEAVGAMQGCLEIVRSQLHGFDFGSWFMGTAAQRLALLPSAMEFLLEQDLEQGKRRFLDATTALSRTFALLAPHPAALAIREELAFYQTVQNAFKKTTTSEVRRHDELDSAIRQLVAKSVTPFEIVDLFAAAGINTPDMSILSDEFLAEIKALSRKNLAVEFLKKVLNDEIKARLKTNVVLSNTFAEKLQQAIQKYQNRSISSAAIINELIEMAKELREANHRGEDLGLTEQEVAFYDALAVVDNAAEMPEDETLKTMARELVVIVQRNTTIDWTIKESVRAKLRSLVKRILRRYGYPPEHQEKACQLILSQAELLAENWVASDSL